MIQLRSIGKVDPEHNPTVSHTTNVIDNQGQCVCKL